MADPRVTSIIEAFYPGVSGATAVAESLFGESCRFSKMPYTLLGANFTTESVFKDMSMTNPPGRGYRYYRGQNEIVPFGFGLSYTSFSLKWDQATVVAPIVVTLPASDSTRLLPQQRVGSRGVLRGDDEVLTTVKCVVSNTGLVHGDEIVFLFHNASAAVQAWTAATATDHDGGDGAAPPNDPLAIKQLIGFQRVSLAPGASETVTFPVSLRKLSTVDRHGVRHTLSGEHSLILSRGHGSTLDQLLLLDMGQAGGAPQRVVLS